MELTVSTEDIDEKVFNQIVDLSQHGKESPFYKTNLQTEILYQIKYLSDTSLIETVHPTLEDLQDHIDMTNDKEEIETKINQLIRDSKVSEIDGGGYYCLKTNEIM